MNNEYLEELNNKIRYKKEYIGDDTYRLFIKKNELDFLEKELQRLKAIDNANPSEVLMFIQELLNISETEKHFINLANYDTRLNLIKIKQALIKAQETEKENARYKKALNIIFEKRIDMWHLVDLLDQTYEMYLAFCKSEGYANDYILTQEEFELLKEMLK